ncbi:hypothetical protein VTO73DRAFT_1593 [Trametes versicolor]
MALPYHGPQPGAIRRGERGASLHREEALAAAVRWLRRRASSESHTTSSARKAVDLLGRLPTDPPARAWMAEISPHTSPYYPRMTTMLSMQRLFVLAEVTTPHSFGTGALAA